MLIETLPAAFEMNEILWELREHSAGLNCGRWDYIFSFIKTLREDPNAVMPDRLSVRSVRFPRVDESKRAPFSGDSGFIPLSSQLQIAEVWALCLFNKLFKMHIAVPCNTSCDYRDESSVISHQPFCKQAE